MRFIADFHIHSKYSRAVSKKMVLEEISEWCVKKGINIVSAADFTHPDWFRELKNKLEEAEMGLYKLKKGASAASGGQEIRFILTTEISCIYTKNGKGRRVHILIFAQSLEIAEKINNKLNWVGNLRSDGRPILGLDAKELAKIAFDASLHCLVVPAHIWTPWFSVFGSKSGFNSLKECFDELTPQIYAIETGLSSDPEMNWRIKELDEKMIISGSDAHSLAHLGREACVFEIEREKLSYGEITRVIKEKDAAKFLYTIEFFPEEGMYHYDGHRDCDICFSPEETEKAGRICPKCGRQLTVGVLSRVNELAEANRPEGFLLPGAVIFKKLVPLYEIIAEAVNVGVASKTVMGHYENLIKELENEFNVLLNAKRSYIASVSNDKIAEAVIRARDGKVNPIPGFDGKYGKVKIFEEEEKFGEKEKQNALF